MKFTLDWLKDHLQTEASPLQITAALTELGLEVESVEDPSQTLKGLTVAHVKNIEQHPNADRLNVCKIDDGSENLLKVVCGASNVRADMKVAFASVGTIIPVTNLPLKKGVIRGIESNGMLCSEEELLLSNSSEGIMDLDPSLSVGMDLATALKLNDITIDISITPNRSDCFSVRGIARDLAAYGLGELKPLKVSPINSDLPCPISVQLKDPACPYFTGRIIQNVMNKQSPEWMQKRLKAVGQRCISALVDVTNYILLDIGRPLHVFDADKLQGNIIVRSAHQGEVLEALNGETYTLEEDMTTVCDEKGVLSLGGIMGGIPSSCTENTTNVFLESAYFDPQRTAQTGQALHILSESRTRFERGVDPADVKLGLDKATNLILEICNGTASQTVEAGTLKISSKSVSISKEKLSQYSGLEDFNLDQAAQILQKLEFKIIEHTKDIISVEPPSWRHDISLDVDLIEEILRVNGYDKIPSVSLSLQPPRRSINTDHMIRQTLCQRGLSEVYTWSFINNDDSQLFGQGINLNQPLNQEMATLRPSLIPSHLKAIAFNQNKSLFNSAFFEIAQQFNMKNEDISEISVVCGIRSVNISKVNWLQTPRSIDVYDAKADVVAILSTFNINSYQIDSESAPTYYHPGRKAAIKQGQKILGYFGEIHPKILSEFDVKGPICAFEVILDNLPPLSKKKIAPLELSPFQSVIREFAFIVPDHISADQLIRTVQKIDKNIIKDITIVDVYKGDKLPENHKSLAIQLYLHANDRTLTENDLSTLSENLIKAVQENCRGILRNT